MIFSQFLECIVPQHIAGDILGCLGIIERDTREMVVFIVVVVGAEGHVLRCCLGDNTRRHHIVGMDGVEAHEVGEDLILVLVHNPFFFTHIDHRQHFFPADGGVVFVIGESTRDEFDQ